MRPGAALWPFLLPADQGGEDALCAVSAHGVRIRFADGRELLDGTSGLWNVNLGYGNEAIAAAAADALRRASYLSLFRYENRDARRAADALVRVCGADHYGRVIFSTSGGAANDLAMKLARHYHALAGATQRKLVVGLRGSYHGLTFGGFALTGEDLGQQVYGVDQKLVRHVSPVDSAELAHLLSRHGDRVAAVVVEPVLGTGAVELGVDYIDELLRLRDEHGFLLVADEVATGFGRTGSWFASQRWAQPPDVLIVSKGLTNGTAAAAAVVTSHGVADRFRAAGAVLVHGETQAGTPVTCASVVATITEMGRFDAVTAGRGVARRLDGALAELAAAQPAVVATSGVGCFRAVRLAGPGGDPIPQSDVPRLVAAVRDEGAVVHPGPNGFQLFPALTYAGDDVDQLMRSAGRGIARFLESGRPAPVGVR